MPTDTQSVAAFDVIASVAHAALQAASGANALTGWTNFVEWSALAKATAQSPSADWRHICREAGFGDVDGDSPKDRERRLAARIVIGVTVAVLNQ